MDHLLQKIIRIRPNGGDTECFYVQTYKPVPQITVVAQDGSSCDLPAADYPVATPLQQLIYWVARARADVLKRAIKHN